MSVRFLVGVSVALAACYDVPAPVCGFACGASSECPDGYVCGVDDRCIPPGFENEVCDVPVDPPVAGAPYVMSNSITDQTIQPTLSMIELWFSERVRGLDRETVRFLRDDGVGVTPVAMTASDNAVFFSFPMKTLEAGRSYTIELRGNIFDDDGYRLVPYRSTFPVVEDPAPFISQRHPAVDALNVPVDIKTVIVEISEEVFGFGNGTRITLSTGGVAMPTSLRSSASTYLEFAFPVQLEPSTVYTVDFRTSAMDLGDQPLPPATWQFTTGLDTVRPVATLLTSTANPLAVNAPIRVQFDEPVVGVSASTIQLESNGVPVPAAVSYDATQRVAMLRPTLQLQGEQLHRLSLASGIADARGNALLPLTVEYITLFDTVPPGILTTSPAAASAAAPTNTPIVITFDEPVAAPAPDDSFEDMVVTANDVEQSGVLTHTDRTWTFTPTQPLPAGTSIRVRVEVLDLFFNFRQYSYLFTTAST